MSAKDIIQAFPTPASGGILSTIDKEACEKAVGQILDGGEKTLRELADLLVEPGKGNDVQARHALHGTRRSRASSCASYRYAPETSKLPPSPPS